MADPLDDVLRLVSEGRISPAEAAPIIEALAGRRASSADRAASREPASGAPPRGTERPSPGAARAGDASSEDPANGRARRLRIEVRDGGRTVVDVQVPAFLSELAQALPGIPSAYAEQIRSALRSGTRGRILDVRDDDGSGISITVE